MNKAALILLAVSSLPPLTGSALFSSFFAFTSQNSDVSSLFRPCGPASRSRPLACTSSTGDLHIRGKARLPSDGLHCRAIPLVGLGLNGMPADSQGFCHGASAIFKHFDNGVGDLPGGDRALRARQYSTVRAGSSDEALLDGTVVWVELGNRVFASKPELQAVHRRIPARPGRTFWGNTSALLSALSAPNRMPRGTTSVTSDIDFSLFVAVFLVGF